MEIIKKMIKDKNLNSKKGDVKHLIKSNTTL